MNPLRSLLLSGTVACLLGCLAPARAEPLAIRSLAKGGLSGIQEAKQEVIRDQAAWDKIWAQHTTQAKSAGDQPAVDFAKEMVILATFGRRQTGGYSIEITQVESRGDKLCITVARRSPAGRMAIQVLTAPFHMVVVPKNSLPVQFVEATLGKTQP